MKASKNPLVSIIISVYNQWKYLIELKKSIDRQTYKNIEVIVVDDGSKRIPKKAKEVLKNDTLKVIKKNKGANTARNKGLQYAKGKYVLFCDADVSLSKNYIEKMVKVLEKHKDYAFAYSDFKLVVKGEITLYKSHKWNEEKLKNINYISMVSLIRKSALKGIKLDENIQRFQDWDLWLTLMKKGYKGYYINKVLFVAYRLKRGISSKNNYDEKRLVVMKKHNLISEKSAMVWTGSRWENKTISTKKVTRPKRKSKTKRVSLKGLKTDIIIVSRNLEKYTLKALKSIKENTRRPYRIIWVDNGSTQDSRHLVYKYIKRTFKNWKYIWNSDNEGWVGGINQALQIVDADFIVFMNNDVEVTGDWLWKLQFVAMQDKKIGIVGPVSNRGDIGWQRINHLGSWFPEFLNVKKEKEVEKFKNDYSVAPTMLAFFCVLIKKEVIDKIGGLSRDFGKYGLGDDDDFCRRAKEAGYNLAIAKSCLIYHNHRTTFKAEGIDYQKIQKKNLKKIRGVK